MAGKSCKTYREKDGKSSGSKPWGQGKGTGKGGKNCKGK